MSIFENQVKTETKLSKILKYTRTDFVVFKEQPADNKYNPTDGSVTFNAADLFLFFTASIIKESVIFFR